MNILDNIDQIKKIDKSNVYGSVISLHKQCTHAFEETKNIKIPDDFKNVKNIIMTGMGGSGLGARIIESVYANNLKIPLIRVNDYNIPSWANENTLVVCSSYSGTTEEIISTFYQALEKNCKIIVISAGGKLNELAIDKNIPAYKIDPKFNPSNQPRMAIGYSLIGQVMLVSKSGLITFNENEISKIISVMNKVVEKNKVETNEKENKAKQLAKKLKAKNILFVSSGHLAGAMHTVNNQLNENAKTISYDFQIPELNHHLMEGLKHPKSNNDNLFFFFAYSDLYTKRIQQRFDITKDVVSKNDIENYMHILTSKTKLSQTFELIQFGAFVNFYLSVLYEQNPAPIPWVDYFKKKLGQPLS